MAPRKSLVDLERERDRLLERIALQREVFTDQVAPAIQLLRWGDRIVQTAQSGKRFVQAHPWAMGSIAAVLALRKPRKLGRWARRGLLLWRTWRTMRSVMTAVQRGLPPLH